MDEFEFIWQGKGNVGFDFTPCSVEETMVGLSLDMLRTGGSMVETANIF